MANKSYSAVSGSMTKMRAEQIKSEDTALVTLAGELAAIKGQIADIIGDAVEYKEQVPANVQLLDLARHLDASAADGGTLEILNDLNVQETADFDGAVTMQSTLTVSQLATMQNGLTVNTAVADFNAGVTANEIKIDGDTTAGRLYIVGASGELADSADMLFSGGKLAVTGIISGSAALQGASVAVDGAATIGNGMTVNGAAADFNAGVTANEIKIDSDTAQRLYIVGASGELKDEEKLVFDGSKLAVTGIISGSAALQGASVAVDGAATIGGNASVGGDLTVTGNLTVNGTQTVVNTETVTIADHNIVIDSNNGLGAVVDGAGLTFEGGTGDNLTFQWNATHQDMELKLGSNFAKIHVGDLAAVSGAFTGDLDVDQLLTAQVIKIDGDTAQRLYIVDADGSMKDEAKLVFDGSKLAVTGIVSGSAALQGASVSVTGDVAAGAVKISGDTAQRLYIVDADGSMKDEQKLVFDGSKLAVTGIVSGSAALQGASVAVDGLADVGNLRVLGQSRFQGQLRLDAGVALVSGSIVPSAATVFNVGSDSARYAAMFSQAANLSGGVAVDLSGGADQKIWKSGGGGDLVLSSSVSAGYIKFDDAYRGATTLSGGVSGLRLANSGEWATFASSFPSVNSILGAFNAIAAGGGAEKGYFMFVAPVAAETGVDINSGPGMSDMSFAGLTKDNSMVFFNGQLLRSGSVANLAAPASADYSFDGGAASVKFAFAVEVGDQLVVQKL